MYLAIAWAGQGVMGGLKTWGRRFAQSAPMWLKTALMTRHYTECVGRASARTL